MLDAVSRTRPPEPVLERGRLEENDAKMNLDRKRDYWESYEDAIKLISSVYGRFSDNVDGKYCILACDNDWLLSCKTYPTSATN